MNTLDEPYVRSERGLLTGNVIIDTLAKFSLDFSSTNIFTNNAVAFWVVEIVSSGDIFGEYCVQMKSFTIDIYIYGKNRRKMIDLSRF